ncbi:MAG: hypothetical protein IKM32_06775 [Clostridia bacterium]|nr:hypothetical protein [Clostridia bacterium]
MKKLLCLISAILMLLSVACTEASVDESSSTAEESITNISDDINSNSLDNPENPEAESSKTETSGFEQDNSKDVSNESSEPAYIFEPRDETYGFATCDHGAVFMHHGFHDISSFLMHPYDPKYSQEPNYASTPEQALKHAIIALTEEELLEWWHSETPDEYKFECNVHDTNIKSTDYRDSDIELHKNKNIVMFLRQFNADRDQVARIYYGTTMFYYYYLDFDVLLDWEYQDACNWYLDYYNKYREILEAKRVLGDVRSKLVLMYEPKEERRKGKSVTQLIYENKKIPREKVEELIESKLNYYKSGNEKLHTGEVVISYKLDEVYNQSDEFMELLEKFYNGEIYTYQLDEWLMDIQYN